MGVLLSNMDKIYSVITLLLSALIIRSLLVSIGQTWLRTQSATLSVVLIPLITYVITTVISGNIALSLGMVGALSIVRFRNPVKSPLELVTYFLMITLGVAASVSIKWASALALASSAVIVASQLISKTYFILMKKKLFPNSFAEANSLFTLEIIADRSIPDFSNSQHLISLTKTDGAVVFRFASERELDLKPLVESAQSLECNFSFRAA